MATKRKAERYNEATIAQRIAEARVRLGVTVKEVCEAAGLTAEQWSRKIRVHRNSFTLAEYGAIADLFDAPDGWPFVKWEYDVTTRGRGT